MVNAALQKMGTNAYVKKGILDITAKVKCLNLNFCIDLKKVSLEKFGLDV